MKFTKKPYRRKKRQQHSPEYVAEMKSLAEQLAAANPEQASYIWKALDISLNP